LSHGKMGSNPCDVVGNARISNSVRWFIVWWTADVWAEIHWEQAPKDGGAVRWPT
jgi:hypothetical protein